MQVLKRFVKIEVTVQCPKCHDILIGDLDELSYVESYEMDGDRRSLVSTPTVVRKPLTQDMKVSNDLKVWFKCPTCNEEHFVEWRNINAERVYVFA